MACISLPTAMLIGGGLSAAGGVASAVIGSNAAQSAAATQSATADKQLAATQQMFGTVSGDMQPYISAGNAALLGVQNLLGTGPNGTAGELQQLQATPGYQFALTQGLQATQNGYAAQGLGQSGAALKGAANYSEGLAESTYSNVFNNFLNTAQLGQSSVGQLASAAGQFQGAENQLAGTSAAAQAAGTVGSANAITSGITNALGGISNASMLLGLNSSGMFGASNSGSGVNGLGATTSGISGWAG